ncbi:MAG: peptidylprolyl isomerase, partial [Methanoregula sp.]
MTSTQAPGKRVRLETNMGTITIALDPEMPITAGNFETLAQKGYY